MGVLPIVNSKYLPLTLWIILLVVCLVVAGFSDFNLVMIGIDLAMVIALLPIRKEINTQMNKKESKKILKGESPIQWSTNIVLFSILSFFSLMLYEIITRTDLIINVQLNNSLLIFGITFIIFGFVSLCRLTVFVFEPASKGNIIAGKIIYLFSQIGIRFILISFIFVLQVFNLLMLGGSLSGASLRTSPLTPMVLVYLGTIVLSFIAMFPIIYNLIFHLTKQVKRLDWAIIVAFFSPWLVFTIIAVFLFFGIKTF